LSLTAKGLRLARRAPDVAQERLINGIDQLPAARRKQLAIGLGELAKAIDAAELAPAMFFEDRPAPKPAPKPKRRIR